MIINSVSRAAWLCTCQESLDESPPKPNAREAIEEKRATKAVARKTRTISNASVGLALLVLCFGSLPAADLRLNDSNPLAMPAVGSYGLRILSPTVIELTLITTKDQTHRLRRSGTLRARTS